MSRRTARLFCLSIILGNSILALATYLGAVGAATEAGRQQRMTLDYVHLLAQQVPPGEGRQF